MTTLHVAPQFRRNPFELRRPSPVAESAAGCYEQALTGDETAADDVPMFLMPGGERCFGGPGPSWVNFLTEIDRWVETNQVPKQITAYWLDESMQPAGSRPVCAYPNVLEYDGVGGPRGAASFRWVNPE